MPKKPNFNLERRERDKAKAAKKAAKADAKAAKSEEKRERPEDQKADTGTE